MCLSKSFLNLEILGQRGQANWELSIFMGSICKTNMKKRFQFFSSNHDLFISRSTRIQDSMSLFTFSHNLLKFDLRNFFALFLHVSHTATLSVETRVTSGTTKWLFSSVNPDMSDHITPGFHRFWTHWTNVLVINLQRNNLHLQ